MSQALGDKSRNTILNIWCAGALIIGSPLLGVKLLNAWGWDLTVPFFYSSSGADEIWQLICTKGLLDTGWVLTNQFLGAPGVSEWYNNSGAQTSALHSLLMLFISIFVKDAVAVQQIYFFLNFGLISLSSFLVARTLGVSRAFACCIGLLFAFTSFRIHALFFAFLSNYFIIPISILPSIWIMMGKVRWGKLSRSNFRSHLAAAISMICVTAVSDGYYAFFALLLLGFAGLFRALRRASIDELAGIGTVIGTMLIVVLALQYPIQNFRANHPDQANQDRMKQPHDAEVYSPSLKFLIAPIPDHRIQAFANFGKWLVETGNFNRRFPNAQGAPVVLGIIGTALLAVAFIVVLVRPRFGPEKRSNVWSNNEYISWELIWSIGVLSIFVLLCTLQGALGSLIALIYPSIRAYERFGLFLVYLLLLGGGLVATKLMLRKSSSGYVMAGVALFVTGVGIYDQVPRDVLGLNSEAGRTARSETFLAERKFVAAMEKSLPKDAMVYQYPFSQYLTSNKYYGWGSFGQLRLYMHSRNLHWSNGAAKGSPIDQWHERVSFLPLQDMLTEVRSVAFSGVVVDGSVLPEADYRKVREVLNAELGSVHLEDSVTKLGFWNIPENGHKIILDESSGLPDRLVVYRALDIEKDRVSRVLNRTVLTKMLGPNQPFPVTYERRSHPQLFVNQQRFDRGVGQTRIGPIQDMQGDIVCDSAAGESSIILIVKNRSSFDWKFNEGQYPLRLSMHLYRSDGSLARPDGFSVPTDTYLPAGESTRISVDSSMVFSPALAGTLTARFALMQDGNAWFSQPGNAECTVTK